MGLRPAACKFGCLYLATHTLRLCDISKDLRVTPSRRATPDSFVPGMNFLAHEMLHCTGLRTLTPALARPWRSARRIPLAACRVAFTPIICLVFLCCCQSRLFASSMSLNAATVKAHCLPDPCSLDPLESSSLLMTQAVGEDLAFFVLLL